jgi:dipeptide transport system substrate-binding protein
VPPPSNPNAKRIGELMQADLAKVGIKAEIKSFEWGEYRKRAQNGEHQMVELGWTGDNGDPDNFLHVLLGCDAATTNGGNVAKWCYKPFDDLITEAEHTTDIYRKAQAIFKDEAPWFTIAHSVQYAAVSQKVEDFRLSPFGRHEFYGVDLK